MKRITWTGAGVHRTAIETEPGVWTIEHRSASGDSPYATHAKQDLYVVEFWQKADRESIVKDAIEHRHDDTIRLAKESMENAKATVERAKRVDQAAMNLSKLVDELGESHHGTNPSHVVNEICAAWRQIHTLTPPALEIVETEEPESAPTEPPIDVAALEAINSEYIPI